MDFAKLMGGAMSKSSSASKGTNDGPKSKYLKRSEVEAQREANYLAEQAAAEQAAVSKAAAKRKREADEAERDAMRERKKQQLAEESRARREEEARTEEEARRKRLGLPPLPDPSDDTRPGVPADEDIPEEELVEKLRALAEPARLFGETHAARLRRYRVLMAPKVAWSETIIPTTLALVAEADMQVPAGVPAVGTAERAYVMRQLASYFTLVLTARRASLAARSDEVKESTTGKQAAQALAISIDNLRPLFRRFEADSAATAVPAGGNKAGDKNNGTTGGGSSSKTAGKTAGAADNPHVLPTDMLAAILSIVRCAQARRYVDANNAYLELSIGKQAWPIGVVSVGIHARASRSRIGEERAHGVAHIMGDETARRWLQAIKRCLTYAQTRWPPDDGMQLMG